MQIIDIIILDEAQTVWVNSENELNDFKAPICNYIDINGVNYDGCIFSGVLTLAGYEDWAAYFSGATVTQIEIEGI